LYELQFGFEPNEKSDPPPPLPPPVPTGTRGSMRGVGLPPVPVVGLPPVAVVVVVGVVGVNVGVGVVVGVPVGVGVGTLGVVVGTLGMFGVDVGVTGPSVGVVGLPVIPPPPAGPVFGMVVGVFGVTMGPIRGTLVIGLICCAKTAVTPATAAMLAATSAAGRRSLRTSLARLSRTQSPVTRPPRVPARFVRYCAGATRLTIFSCSIFFSRAAASSFESRLSPN
jgi:hypothetical protein